MPEDIRTNIVTGATGFIGTALCRELLQQGEKVIAVIRLNSEKKQKLLELQKESVMYEGRMQILEVELDKLEQLSDRYNIEADVFYHLAWNGSSGADRNDFDMQYSNVKYTADAIKTAKQCGCKKIVGAGSQAEYGVVHGVAREDETVPHPFMMYGAAKLAAYQMGQVLAGQLGISFVWPRIYSIYGVGENSGTLVNYIIDTLKDGKIPELSPCENMWNFMYITDCVRALRMLGESEQTQGIYHIASKDTRILKEFVKEIRDIVAPGMELGFGARTSDPNRTFWLEPDVRKIERIGVRSEVLFRDGIERKNFQY